MKRFLTIILMTALTLSTAMPVHAAEPDDAMHDAAWTEYAERSIEMDKTPGLSVAAVCGSETAFKNWGYADLNNQTPMTEDTPVHIGSCSKAFAALSVLLLQEEGKLSAEDSVSGYIPWWHVTYRGQDADIRIWQLLNHCSGLPYVATGCQKDADTEKMALLAKDMELVSEPGARYQYLDFGYCILAYLTQTVSGMPFEEFVVQKIMQPIGMTHSGYELPIAPGYHYFWGRQTELHDIQPSGNAGAALVVTTPSDMVLWMKAQLGQLDLPEQLADAIAASHERNPSHQPKETPDSDYFNGWNQSSDEILWHSGLNANYSARLIIAPKTGIAVFAVSNSTADSPYYAARSCFMNLLGMPAEQFPAIARSDMHKYDLYFTAASVVTAVLLLAAVIMCITQRKRLAGKHSTRRREKTVLILRLTILLPLLGISAALPGLLGAAAGYSGFGYAAFAVWGLQSGLILCLLLDAVFICLIAASILRYVRRRKSV